MKKLITLFLLMAGMAVAVNAQDVITLKNGDEIKAKVTEISSSEIKYKRFDNLEGPTIVIVKNEVFAINYENGTRDVFVSATANEPATAQPAPAATGNECTIIFYRKAKGIPLVLKSMSVGIIRTSSGEVIVDLWDGTYYKYVTSDLGTWEIFAKISKASKPVKLTLEAGKTYYVSVSGKNIGFTYGADIAVVDEKRGLQDIQKLKSAGRD